MRRSFSSKMACRAALSFCSSSMVCCSVILSLSLLSVVSILPVELTCVVLWLPLTCTLLLFSGRSISPLPVRSQLPSTWGKERFILSGSKVFRAIHVATVLGLSPKILANRD